MNSDLISNVFSNKKYYLSRIARYTGYDNAEDVLQDILEKLCKKEYKQSNPDSWLNCVTKNQAIDYTRKFNRVSQLPSDYDIAKDDTLMNDIHAKQLMVYLENKLLTISSEYAKVYMLYEIKDYTHKEIAEKLNISIGTSKSRLSRARKGLH